MMLTVFRKGWVPRSACPVIKLPRREFRGDAGIRHQGAFPADTREKQRISIGAAGRVRRLHHVVGARPIPQPLQYRSARAGLSSLRCTLQHEILRYILTSDTFQ